MKRPTKKHYHYNSYEGDWFKGDNTYSGDVEKYIDHLEKQNQWISIENKFSEKDLQDAMDYGAGVMCGKHNLACSKKERTELFGKFKELLKESKTNPNKR